MYIKNKDEVYAIIEEDDNGIKRELSDYFSFDIPGARFMPKFKNGNWDGKIRLFNFRNGQIYKGLVSRVEEFAKDRNYKINYDKKLLSTEEYSLMEGKKYSETISVNPRDYQIEGFVHAVRNKRCLLLSPTSSGKTMLAYMIAEYYRRQRTAYSDDCSNHHTYPSNFTGISSIIQKTNLRVSLVLSCKELKKSTTKI